jgi:dienelactone hydrolase
MITRREWMSLALPAAAAGQSAVRGVHEEIREQADRAPLAMQFPGGSAGECRVWQKRFAAKLGELLGPYAPPRRWKAILEKTVELEDHRREELVLEAEGERPMPVYLLVPKGNTAGKLPGVVALHGHGATGYDAVAGVARTPAAAQSIAGSNYDYGLQLVRRGMVVAAPCFTPFGRRLDDPKAYRGEDPCGVTFIRMQALGKVLMAENLRDALWSLELVAQHPAVDAQRLACVGLSYGGRMTMLAAALEPRIRVAVISGALNVMQERILGRYGCGAQIIPGLLRYGDVPEIASLIAPRPCLWEVGNQDALMVKDRIGPALERMRRAYRAFGAEDRLEVDFFEGGHRWNGVKAYPLLSRQLS